MRASAVNDLFERPVNRSGLSAMKWEAEIARTGYSDLLSFGTADMDFASPQPVLDAVCAVAKSGHLGYPFIRDSYYRAIEDWLLRTAGWKVDARACTDVGVGIYFSVWVILDALTEPGDEVIIQRPVHSCFAQMVRDNGRTVVANPLKLAGNRYAIDFEQLERCFTPKTKLFWLCNPHNPVGRAWTGEELQTLGEICLRHGVWILSDDVYCGLVYPGHRYTPIASLSRELSERTVTCYSPSKSYNTTGIKFSYVLTENPELLDRYNRSLQKTDLHYGVNSIGLAVTEAAYNHCDRWLADLMRHVERNHRLLTDFVAERMPGAAVTEADATYFGWIDFRGLGVPSKELTGIFEREAHVLLVDGASLGPGGEGFIRINLGCTEETLLEGLSRIEKVYRPIAFRGD